YEVGFMGENRKDNRQIKFRVSDHEYEELEQTANNFHMSVPAFAKKRALGYRMKPPKVDKSGAIEIAKQLRAIGNNVNQLTKRAIEKDGYNLDINYVNYQINQTIELLSKNYGIQAHHVIQSFKPNEVTPEKANQVVLELAKKISPIHEIAVYTNDDTSHFHNH